MDAPPENENSRPFVQVAGFLESMGLNAARVIEANLDDGFLLLSDLGSRQYLDELLDDPDSAPRLYGDALSALLTMQRSGVPMQAQLPPYDDAMLRFEMSLFHDWLCGTHLDISLSEADEREWQSACDMLVANALDQPRVFVHRDYHSRNLMVTATDNPGILDFQDAVEGPLTYDLVSLLKDCYVKWPSEQVWQWALDFYHGLDARTRELVDEEQFRQGYFDRWEDTQGENRTFFVGGLFDFDFVEGVVRYSFPAVHGGREVEGIRLEFRSGRVVEATPSLRLTGQFHHGPDSCDQPTLAGRHRPYSNGC